MVPLSNWQKSNLVDFCGENRSFHVPFLSSDITNADVYIWIHAVDSRWQVLFQPHILQACSAGSPYCSPSRWDRHHCARKLTITVFTSRNLFELHSQLASLPCRNEILNRHSHKYLTEWIFIIDSRTRLYRIIGYIGWNFRPPYYKTTEVSSYII